MEETEAICTYFERDTLGQIANLHLALAILNGVEDEDTELASYLCGF